jgi:hypothetical protein
MADCNSNSSNFVRIVYIKVKTNGQTELVPLKLYTDVPVEELALPWVAAKEAAIPGGNIDQQPLSHSESFEARRIRSHLPSIRSTLF